MGQLFEEYLKSTPTSQINFFNLATFEEICPNMAYKRVKEAIKSSSEPFET
jgi:hypothetical protein